MASDEPDVRLEDEMMEAMARLEARLDALPAVEAKLDALIALLGGASKVMLPSSTTGVSEGVLRRMTPKQHATLQMIVRGASNPEIADRLGVTVNTAKVHVRSMFPKFGIRDRDQVAQLAKDLLVKVDADEYERMSGGLPKDWDAKFRDVEHCPYRHLYRAEA